jgi:hypothetical protein
MNAIDPHTSETSHRELAAGTLKQATQDLRRFHGATTAIERELYHDAYSWVMSDDCGWPFSFLNVCQLLNRVPDDLREELLGDLSLSAFRQLTRRWCRALRRLSHSLTKRMTTDAEENTAAPANLMQTST